jgi:hypothetical protein
MRCLSPTDEQGVYYQLVSMKKLLKKIIASFGGFY